MADPSAPPEADLMEQQERLRGEVSEMTTTEDAALMSHICELLRTREVARQAIIAAGGNLGPYSFHETARFTTDSDIARLHGLLPQVKFLQQVAYDRHRYEQVCLLAATCAGVAVRLGQYASGAAMLTLGRQAAEKAGEAHTEAQMRIRLAELSLQLGELDRADEHARATLERHRTAGQPADEAAAIRILGAVALAEKDFDVADELFAAAREIFQQLGDKHGLALLNRDQGHLALAAGKPHAADHRFATAVCHFGIIAPDAFEHARTLLALASVYAMSGHQKWARKILKLVLDLAQSGGWPAEQATAHTQLAQIADEDGAPKTAEQHRATAAAIHAGLEEERVGALAVLRR